MDITAKEDSKLYNIAYYIEFQYFNHKINLPLTVCGVSIALNSLDVMNAIKKQIVKILKEDVLKNNDITIFEDEIKITLFTQLYCLPA